MWKKINLLACLLGLIAAAACKKNAETRQNEGFDGRLQFKIRYSLDEQVSSRGAAEFHSGLGSYIGSITPSVFIGKFLDMRIQTWKRDGTAWDVNCNLIDNNTPMDSSNRIADFSNGSQVSIYPKIDGQPGPQGLVFNMFMFINLFYYQEFELPEPYDTVVNLKMLEFGGTKLDFTGHFMGGVRNGRSVKGSSSPLLAPLYDNNWSGFQGHFPRIPAYFVFGETDSAYSFMGTQNVLTIDNPIGQEGPVMRSPHYDPIVIKPVPDDSTYVVNGVMTFDTENLIQIYAGRDNRPYTSDDVFVYAPKYWNRIKAMMK